jgi:hypothetical protein
LSALQLLGGSSPPVPDRESFATTKSLSIETPLCPHDLADMLTPNFRAKFAGLHRSGRREEAGDLSSFRPQIWSK